MVARIYTEEMLRKCLNADNTEVIIYDRDGNSQLVILCETNPNHVDLYDINNRRHFSTVRAIDLEECHVVAQFHHFAEDISDKLFISRYGYLTCDLDALENTLLEEHLAIQAGIDPHADSENEEDWEEFWNLIIATQPQDPSELADFQFPDTLTDPFDFEEEINPEDYDY